MSAPPLIDITADGHLHTRFCNHARGEMEEFVEAAINCGLRQITFLEHLEVDIDYDHRTWLRAIDFQTYFHKGNQLKTKYTNRIEIRLGIEVGLNLQAIEKIKQSLTQYPWETIGLSYHFFRHNGRHYNMVSRRQENLTALTAAGIDRVIDDYFTGLIQGVQDLPCTMVCHLDAVLRHLPDLRFNENHWQLIDTLLKLMQRKGTALEINTSGFANRNEPYPNKRITRRARELGIQLIAGSDAHRPDQVGRFFAHLPGWLH